MPITDDELTWELGARTPGHDYKIFRTQFVHGQHGDKSIRFSLIESVDWVNVIALTTDQRVVMIRQYRPGVDRVCIEIPGGMVDPGEDARTAAMRELAEETGYAAPEWRLLGTVAPNPAIQNNLLHSYLALGAEPTGGQRLDGNEVLALDLIPLPEVHAMLRSGRIDHALVINAFAHLAFEQAALRQP